MTLRLNGDSSGFTEIKAADAAGDNSIKLPASNGSANQLLQNGGTAGELQYTSAGGGLHYDSNGDLMLGASSFTGFAGGDRRFLINGATNARQEFGVGGSQIGGLYADADRLVVYTSASDYLSFQTSGTERLQLASTGELKLMSGCPGIDFSGISSTALAGTTVDNNLLDDYEEGTWSPTYSGLTGTTQRAYYIKIGRLVSIHLYFSATSKLASQFNFTLPFAADTTSSTGASSGGVENVGSIMMSNVTPPSNSMQANVYAWDIYVEVYFTNNNNTGWNKADGDEIGDSNILTLQYVAAA